MRTEYTAKRFSGHLVLTGVICLFIAMAFGLGAVALTGQPGGSTLMFFAKLFGFLWLPLVGIGALLRATGADNPPPEQQSSAREDAVINDSQANGA